MSKTRIESVAIKGDLISIGFSKENGAVRDEYTMTSSDQAMPSFGTSMLALKSHVLQMLGLDGEYGLNMAVLSVGIKFKGVDERMGATISCEKYLKGGSKPFTFTTPYRSVAKEIVKKGKKATVGSLLDTLTPECVSALKVVQDEALGYLNGKRAQMEFSMGESVEVSKKETIIASKEEANLIEEAKAIIVETQRASTAMIMKRMKISFREAADIMDKLEAEGMIGPPTGSGSARKILVAA